MNYGAFDTIPKLRKQLKVRTLHKVLKHSPN